MKRVYLEEKSYGALMWVNQDNGERVWLDIVRVEDGLFNIEFDKEIYVGLSAKNVVKKGRELLKPYR